MHCDACAETLRYAIKIDVAHLAMPRGGISRARIASGISDAIAMIRQRLAIMGGAPLAMRVRIRADSGSAPGGAVMRAMGTSRRHKMYAASHAQASVLAESGIEIRNNLRAHIAALSRPASSNDMGISISPASDNLVVTAQYCAVYPRINRTGVA